ncbi:MAG: UDP-2,3-diacylglucosamine diphosphatase [Candidatus Krumholzibacteriota bacterium]|nr:UDP-2,3-diacylglucosamine diphosphatase [Candidatus Krumholzibacteriota bacterium]
MESRPIYFVSDSHFRPHPDAAERERVRRFFAFLEHAAGAKRLYIVGDLFDFWLEYRSVAPRGYTDILLGLRRLRDAGTGVTLLGGNHDYWLGSFLSDEMGFDLAPDGLLAEHQGRRLRIDHGDESLSGDRGYLTLKTVIRHPLFVGAARLFHPDFTFWAARQLASASRRQEERHRRAGRPPRSLRLRRLLTEDFDALILGHLHLGFHYLYRGWEILCLGDWVERFSYARLVGGRLELRDDRGGVHPARRVADPDGPAADWIAPASGPTPDGDPPPSPGVEAAPTDRE